MSPRLESSACSEWLYWAERFNLTYHCNEKGNIEVSFPDGTARTYKHWDGARRAVRRWFAARPGTVVFNDGTDDAQAPQAKAKEIK